MTRTEYQDMSAGYSPLRPSFTVHHDPEGYACNMGWIVRNAAGAELYRGPQWAAKENARKRNDGTYVDPLLRRAQAALGILQALTGRAS